MTEQDPTPAPEDVTPAAPTAAEKRAAEKAAKAEAAAAAKAAKAQADAELKAAKAAEAAAVKAQQEADKAEQDDDPNVGVFVGYGATCHGTEDGMYAVDPDSGITTGVFVPTEE